jgi:hypothetical protein
VPKRNPKLNGCPSSDRDGDTIANEDDHCPDQAETWNGISDDDGCPEPLPLPYAQLRSTTTKMNVPPRSQTSPASTNAQQVQMQRTRWFAPSTDVFAQADIVPRAADRDAELRALATLANGSGSHEILVVLSPIACDMDGRRMLARQLFLSMLLTPYLRETVSLVFAVAPPVSRDRASAAAGDLEFWLR